MTCGPHPLLIHNLVHPNTEPRPPIQVQASVCTQPPLSKTQTHSMHSHYSPPAAVYLIHDPAVIRQSPADSFLAYGDTRSKRKYIVFKDIFLTANVSQSLTYPSKWFFFFAVLCHIRFNICFNKFKYVNGFVHRTHSAWSLSHPLYAGWHPLYMCAAAAKGKLEGMQGNLISPLGIFSRLRNNACFWFVTCKHTGWKTCGMTLQFHSGICLLC